MNRIRQIREGKGISQSKLAEMCNTTQPTIQRLESGERQLTEHWMRLIAERLDVNPADLIDLVNFAEISNDVTPNQALGADIAAPLSKLGIQSYRVLTDNVSLAGIKKNDIVVADATAVAVANAKVGDIVVLSLIRRDGEEVLLLRQFLPPALATTNRPGSNVVMSIDDPQYRLEIVAVVKRV